MIEPATQPILRNKAGAFVLPSQAAVHAAPQFPHVNSDNFAIVNAPGQMSYPIAGFSWVLLRRQSRHDAAALVQLFRWMVTSGQSCVTQVNDAPLPVAVQQQALNTIK